MEPLTLVLTALGIVTGWLGVVVKILWKRSEECEADRKELRAEVEEVRQALGEASGSLKMYVRCPMQHCPYRSPTGVQHAPPEQP